RPAERLGPDGGTARRRPGAAEWLEVRDAQGAEILKGTRKHEKRKFPGGRPMRLSRPGLRGPGCGFPGARTASGRRSLVRVVALVQVVAEDLGTRGVAEFGHGLGFDLADPLAGDAVDLADLVQRLGLAVGQPEPHRDHPGLP